MEVDSWMEASPLHVLPINAPLAIWEYPPTSVLLLTLLQWLPKVMRHPKPSSIIARMVFLSFIIASETLSNGFRVTSASCSCLEWLHCFDGCYVTLPRSIGPAIAG